MQPEDKPVEEAEPRNYFPELSPYTEPTTGLLSKLPNTWVPYAQLMRLDRPAGLCAFYFPYLIGTAYAVNVVNPLPSPEKVLGFAVLLLPLNIILRGIVCAWNDNVDQAFDRKVERCRHRPIARGAVTTFQGHVFTVSLAVFGSPSTVFLPPACSGHLAFIVVLFFLYALAKRATYYPQVVLGLPFAWAVPFCTSAFGITPDHVDMVSTIALVGALCVWTIVYDTVYAHQDIADDENAGVKSMALRFRDTTKALATWLTLSQAVLLTICGIASGFGCIYFTGTVLGTTLAMGYLIYSVDLSDPKSCGSWFLLQFWTVGGALMSGLAGQYLVAVYSINGRKWE